MAYKIIGGSCTACGACEYDCPNTAIKMKGETYIINADTCSECEGFFDAPQCLAVCPSDSIVQA